MSIPHPSRAVNHTELKPKGTLKFRGYPMKRTEISPFAKVMASSGMGEEKINQPESTEVCFLCGKSVVLRKMVCRSIKDKQGNYLRSAWICTTCKPDPNGFAW